MEYQTGIKAIVTGQSGINKKAYLEEVIKVAENNGITVRLFNVGDMMYEEARKESLKIQHGKILNLELSMLTSIRRVVFEDILREYRSGENIIINTHSCFTWRGIFFHAFDFDKLVELSPDMYITIVDDIDAIKLRLDKKEDPHMREYTLKDIMTWRAVESMATEIIAYAQRKLLYLFLRGYSPVTMFKLLFGKNLKKTYVSFPISLVRDNPEIIKDIDSFREKIEQSFIAFDPYKMQEIRLYLKAQEAIGKGEQYITVETLGVHQEFNVTDIMSIATEIDAHIRYRDFQLINQSDMIIAYIPEIHGKPEIASGVERELEHAHRLAKEVYVICPAREKLSPWVRTGATKVFGSLEEALKYFGEKGYMTV